MQRQNHCCWWMRSAAFTSTALSCNPTLDTGVHPEQLGQHRKSPPPPARHSPPLSCSVTAQQTSPGPWLQQLAVDCNTQIPTEYVHPVASVNTNTYRHVHACMHKKSMRPHVHTRTSHTHPNCFKHTKCKAVPARVSVCVSTALKFPQQPTQHILKHTHTHTFDFLNQKHMWRVMRLHGSLRRKHFLAQLKCQQWRRKRRKTPLNNNKEKRNTAARSDRFLSPRLNKSSWGVRGGSSGGG